VDRPDRRPALQTLAILQLFSQLDAPTQTVANAVIAANLNSCRAPIRRDGQSVGGGDRRSFFARSVQLECFQAITATPSESRSRVAQHAIPWLQNALQQHWNGQYYQSLLPSDRQNPTTPTSTSSWRDLRRRGGDGHQAAGDRRAPAQPVAVPASAYFYPINGADQQRGIGPLLGRYPGDTTTATAMRRRRSPLGVSTCNFAELHYAWRARSPPERFLSTPTPHLLQQLE